MVNVEVDWPTVWEWCREHRWWLVAGWYVFAYVVVMIVTYGSNDVDVVQQRFIGTIFSPLVVIPAVLGLIFLPFVCCQGRKPPKRPASPEDVRKELAAVEARLSELKRMLGTDSGG